MFQYILQNSFQINFKAHTDMAKVADLVTPTMETLQQFRSDKELSKLYKYVIDVAFLHKIEIAPQQSQRQRTMPKRFEDVIVLESIGCRKTATTNDDYKISLYFAVLNAMISELRSRFEDKNIQINEGNTMLQSQLYTFS